MRDLLRDLLLIAIGINIVLFVGSALTSSTELAILSALSTLLCLTGVSLGNNKEKT